MKVLKFGAIWCNACLVMKPRWKKIEEEFPWLESEYFEYDDSQNDVKKYNISSEKIPTFVFLDKHGDEIERHSGELSIADINEILIRLKNK